MKHCSRRSATIALSTVTLAFFLVLLSCIGFGLPGTERNRAVYGADIFSDTDVVLMSSAWTKIESTEASSRELLNAGVLYDTQALSPAAINRIRALRRMALYTTEPDEMHVPLALGRMKPRQFDFNPHYFQYGGFLFYGCGFFVGLAGLAGFVPLSGGLEPILRRPDLMANFYVAARLWTILWSALMPIFLYRLGRLFMSRGCSLAAVVLALSAPGLYLFGPIAKHVSMAGSIGVLATYLGCRILTRGRRRDFIFAGAAVGLAGAAFPTHLILVIGYLFACGVGTWKWRAATGGRATAGRPYGDIVAGLFAAGIVFLAFNPYWILDYQTVISDMQHAMAWYKPNVSIATVSTVMTKVFPAAVGFPLAIIGTVIVGGALIRGTAIQRTITVYSLTVLLFYGYRITGVEDLGPFWCRQFLMVGPLWAVLAVSALSRWKNACTGVVIAAVVVSVPACVVSVFNYYDDSSTESTRYRAGRWIETHIPVGTTIHLTQTPGPFSSPFFNLNHYPVEVADTAADLHKGDIVVSVGTPNEIGRDTYFRELDRYKVFESERRFSENKPFPDAIGFANAPVKIWVKR